MQFRRNLTASEFRLSAGNHPAPDDGLCAMEVVALLDGQPHSDHPRCTCEIIGAFVRGINDNMPDDLRQTLLPILPRLVGTVSEEHEQARHEFFAWQAVRVFAPAALRAKGYGRFAKALESVDSLLLATLSAEAIGQALANCGPVGEGRNGCKPTAVELAVHHARRAAGAALWFSGGRHDFAKGSSSITPWDQCSSSAASAAFQAYNVGCTEVWGLAIRAIDEALEIGHSIEQRGLRTPYDMRRGR